jgi:hypothetical protein
MNDCKVCGKVFSSESGLHKHLKSHQITMAQYYTTYYPRESLLYKTPISFKNKKDYFNTDFCNKNELLEWCKKEDKNVVSDYMIKKLSDRISQKKLEFAPFHLELELLNFPTIEMYRELFGSYSAACEKAGAKPMFNKSINESFFNSYVPDDLTIFIDTREQEPLDFGNSIQMKLDFGDYTTSGEYYSYTYVDRKSETDFKSTLSSNNLDRFRAELDRAKKFDSYLYIVIESSIREIEKQNKYSAHKANLSYIFHNMRNVQHEFSKNCQFIFSGSRKNSQKLIPKLLYNGKKLWNVDLQYYIDKYKKG